MGAARSFFSPLTTVALLLGTTTWSLAQGSGGDAGNWLTQPAPGVPGGSSSTGRPSGGQGGAGGQSVPGAGGWNVRPGEGGQLIYTPNGSSGGGQSVPGINGWNVRQGEGGQMIYTPSGSSGGPAGSSGNGSGVSGNTSGSSGSATGASGTDTGSSSGSGWSSGSSGSSAGGTASGTSPDAGSSGSSGSAGGTGNVAGSPFDGQEHPVPGKPGWMVRWDAASGKFVYSHPQQPPQPPPPPVTHEEEGGWVDDKNGRTKVVYIKDAQGNVVGGYYAHYDAQGNFKGKEPFNGLGTPTTSDLPSQADLQGNYSGSFSGGATGHITLYVSGAIVSGTISGTKDGDAVHAQFSGAIDGSGRFGANISGTVEWGKGIAFGGNMEGRIDKNGGSGTWTGAGGLDKASGSWRISR